MKIEWGHHVTLGAAFAIAYLCPLCGALIYPASKEIHEDFHEALTQTAQQADSADGMWRPLA